MREPRDIWLIRQVVQRWPLPRGKGIVLRLARRRLARRDFPVVLEAGAVIAPEFDDWIVRYAFEGRQLHDAAFQLSFGLLRPGDYAMDVGANIGLWSLVAARRVGQAGCIWAFEAMPDTVARLRRNWKMSGAPAQLRIEAAAASESDGTVTIYRSSDANSSTSTLRPVASSTASFAVPSVRLDRIWRDAGAPAIRLLKVDVEGAEYKVLAGARELLSKAAPVVVFECDRMFLRDSGATPEQVFALLEDCGYAMYAPTKESLRPVAEAPTEHCDLIAMPIKP